ncbi:MAG: hypothetical protein H6611_03080 [Ignavibacteriales bacterium]|nr:hypothetical protein [Ignavibacteriales bacterium]
MDILYYIISKTSELIVPLTTELVMGYGIDEYQLILSTFLYSWFLYLLYYIIILVKKDYLILRKSYN